MRKRTPNTLKAVIIVHGKSEFKMCEYIRSNLRLHIDILARNKGGSSIQINTLVAFLNKGFLKSATSFLNHYNNQLAGKKLKDDFRIFTVMDTDDCSEQERDNYINRNMFRNHWAYDYIYPIYNISNLEDVLLRAGLINRNHDKKDYNKIFSINHDASYDDIKDIKTFRDKIKGDNNTNMDDMLDDLLKYIDE